MPPEASGRTLVKVPGNHSLTGDIGTLRGAVGEWLAGIGRFWRRLRV
jgi:hypothetical protein